MMCENKPTKPFQIVAADLFMIDVKEYLAYADRFSEWVAVHPFHKDGISSTEVEKPIRTFFRDQGVPQVLTDVSKRLIAAITGLSLSAIPIGFVRRLFFF